MFIRYFHTSHTFYLSVSKKTFEQTLPYLMVFIVLQIDYCSYIYQSIPVLTRLYNLCFGNLF